jgi:hypothetical protein
MRESRTYGSVRGARDETRVPTATDAFLPRRMSPEVAQGCGSQNQSYVRSWRKLTCACKAAILILTHLEHWPESHVVVAKPV